MIPTMIRYTAIKLLRNLGKIRISIPNNSDAKGLKFVVEKFIRVHLPTSRCTVARIREA